MRPGKPRPRADGRRGVELATDPDELFNREKSDFITLMPDFLLLRSLSLVEAESEPGAHGRGVRFS